MPQRLMCITAHPDDESGAFGGALAMAHAAGVETTVLCLTEGAAGSYRPDGLTNEELARIRRAEFADACELLGVTNAILLRYPDGALASEPFLDLVQLVAEHLRACRPQVVLTFAGDGNVNQHRDHTIVSLAATAAFHWAGRENSPLTLATRPYAPQKLYYAGTPFLAVRSEQDKAVAARTPHSLSLELRDYKEKKIAAFLKHTTQQAILDRVRDIMEPQLDYEHYLLAASRKALPLSQDIALFSDVLED
ncbi:MAG: PIG-L family deacetylase [Acidobacteria bacterium]|nr:PIG-L family deacetylase [Acidobacteriota bacterium]MBW4045756.1 PIG-L family deacetylase [Acidobacteriota bacterium]